MFQYTIQPGDTLYKIAAMFNVPIGALMAANPGLYPYNLLIGQAIMIPTTYYPRTPSFPGVPGFPVPRPYGAPFSERREQPMPPAPGAVSPEIPRM